MNHPANRSRDEKPHRDPDLYFEEACEAVERGNLPAAKEAFKAAFQYGKDPAGVDALVALAETFMDQELWKDGEEALLEALRVAPDHGAASRALEALHANPSCLAGLKPCYDEEVADRLVKKTVISPVPPLVLTIELTNQDREKEIASPNRDMKGERGIMDFDLFRKIVDESAEGLNLERVRLAGPGEPYLIPRLMDYLDYGADKYGIRGTETVLVTQGEQITDLHFGVTRTEIRFRGSSRETYEKRTGLSFDRTVENLWRLQQEGQLDRKTLIQMPLSEDTAQEGEAFKRLFAYTNAALGLAQMHDSRQPAKRIPCRHVRGAMHITWTGDLILCPHDVDRSMPYGNVREKSLQELWYSHGHKKRVADHGACRFEGLCASCSFNLDREERRVVLSKEERIALRKKHADLAWNRMVQCEHAEGCEIVKRYLEKMDEIESLEDDLVSICSDDYRFYGLDAVMDPAQHPHCPGLARLRKKMGNTRVCWESSMFGPSGYAFAGRGHIFGLNDLGARVHTHPILGDCKMEMGIEENADG